MVKIKIFKTFKTAHSTYRVAELDPYKAKLPGELRMLLMNRTKRGFIVLIRNSYHYYWREDAKDPAEARFLARCGEGDLLVKDGYVYRDLEPAEILAIRKLAK